MHSPMPELLLSASPGVCRALWRQDSCCCRLSRGRLGLKARAEESDQLLHQSRNYRFALHPLEISCSGPSSIVVRGHACRATTGRDGMTMKNAFCNTGGTRTKDTGQGFSANDPAQTVVWGGKLPSRRRAITGGLSGLAIVLVSNLGGVTGAVLGLDGGLLAGALHLDVLYPVRGLKRCLDAQNGFEFQYPGSWLADQRMFRRNAERQEAQSSLDPPSTRQPRRQVAEPIAAFGPAGSSGELNISVIVAPIQQGFSLQNLGSPEDAGRRILDSTIANKSSGVVATLLAASQKDDSNGQLYYTMEYRVERPGGFQRHNVSSYAARSGFLYTLNAQSSEAQWPEVADILRKSVSTFTVNRKGPPPAKRGIPY